MNDLRHINLARIDLNLLVVFDALMSERNVTRAGEKIGLSQPATSNALSRLRKLFEDELFVRMPDGMQPTARAIALQEPIRQVLLQIQSALAGETPFLPELSERVFNVGMSDCVEFILLPELMHYLELIAPKITIRVRVSDRQKALKMLDNGDIDLAIGFFPESSSWHRMQFLFAERFVCVCSQNNAIAQEPLALESYLAASHLLVSPKEEMSGRVDAFLAERGLKRRIAITIPHFLAAPFIIANTNLIATLVERVSIAYSDLLGLCLLPLPFEMPCFSVSMLWHAKNNNESAHIWLRYTIAKLCPTENTSIS